MLYGHARGKVACPQGRGEVRCWARRESGARGAATNLGGEEITARRKLLYTCTISLPGGTAGWLWNLRSEQGYRAMPLSNSTSSTQHHRLGQRSRLSEHRPMATRGCQPSMGHLQDASLADWDTHTKPSAATPTPSKRTTRSPGAYSDLLLLYGPGPGTSQPTRIHIPQVATHK